MIIKEKEQKKMKKSRILVCCLFIVGVFTMIGCTQPAQIVVPDEGVDCPQDNTIDASALYKDSLSTSNTYINPTIILIPKTDGQSRIEIPSLNTDGSFSAVVDVPCLKSGTKWEPVALTLKGESHSIIGTEFIAQGSVKKIELTGKGYDDLQFRVQDKISGGNYYFDIANCGSIGTGWHDFGTSECIVQNVGGSSALNIQEDGSLEFNIMVKTQENKKQFGEDGLKTFVMIDADTSQWQEPSVDSNGVLTSDRDQLSDNDKRKFNDFEYVYSINSIGARDSLVKVVMTPISGIDPNFDPIIQFCSEGRYNSNREHNTIKIGCFDDTSAMNGVSSDTVHRFKIDIQ